MLKRVAIFSKDNKLKTREGVSRLIDEFCNRGIRTQIHHKNIDPSDYRCGEMIEHITDPLSEGEKPDLVLSVGGDGTFL